ncbi:hypothetical protein DCO48_03645 [Pseudomonas sp. SDI]|uniref:PqiC family protein n=1 Tax=Pseudomonas sp. SDI TaxID=2170734 RepID=UPI000DE75ABF|nr:PqiC family protein [Pseudomonas sp. SDI]PWB35093.1 hypothetical protein DCO48_03645 [Pseudomonas sp. SDI]
MPIASKITVLATLLVLAACRSDPISFYTLTPAQPAPQARSAGNIQIERISVPPQVDRQQIVIRQGNNALAVLETQWWGASLVDELRSALVDQLSNARSGSKTQGLRVDVLRFDNVPGQYALLDATWRLRAADLRNPLICRSTLQTASGASIDELVTAQQNNVKRLAALIAAAANSNAGNCPTAL